LHPFISGRCDATLFQVQQSIHEIPLKIALFANTDWYLFNFRRSLALALRDAGHEVLLISPPGPYGQRLRDLGLKWTPLSMQRRSLNPLREVRLLVALSRLFKQERIDLVHSFTLKCAVYGSLAARMASVPARVNAVTGMGYVFTSQSVRARMLRPIVRGLLKIALGGPGARLILQNPDDLAFFVRAGLADSSTLHLIPGSGVDCERFFPRDANTPPSAGSRFRVLLPARILWDKGVSEFVEAARSLKARFQNMEFLLAGTTDPGNPASVPESEIRSWVTEGCVTWLGHVEDMPSLFRSVDVVVLPSYREGLPKGLIEAGACGLPLITTDVPGCREVVTHEVDGLLVPVRDVTALIGAISCLASDPGLRVRLAMAARDKAKRSFDETIILHHTLAVYRELVVVIR